MVLCDMPHDGKPQPCTAFCTAAALVDAVKSLEYSRDTLLRYAKPRVGNGQLFVSCHYFDIAVFTVVLYRIIHKVVNKLTELCSASFDDCAFSADSYPDTTLFCLL